MGGPRLSREQRNRELAALDGREGRHGLLRLRQGGAPHANARDRVEFECLACGTGAAGGWEMQVHNVLAGAGCPACAMLAGVASAFRARFDQARLVPLVPRSGPPTVEGLRYEVRPLAWELPADFGWSLPSLAHVSVRMALARNRLPGEEALRKYARFVDVTKAFRAAFPNGRIWFAGDTKAGSTSPGPFHGIDTGPRLLRRPCVLDAISADGVLKHCLQEAKDRLLKARIEEDAERNGATILSYEYRASGGFEIRYLSRTGFAGCDTRWRAEEKFWGQTGFRRGETLALVVLAELFPADDWLRNTRPAFLSKGDGNKLELDGYSPSLALALEYQGKHHYGPRSDSAADQEAHRKVLAHDALKRQLCKQAGVRLVAMKDARLDPDAFLATLAAELAALGIAPHNRAPSIDAVKRRWNDICANPLAPFQAMLEERLGSHTLLDPDLSAVCKTTVIRYRCGNCNADNSASANGFTSGAPRRYCPQCAGQEAGARRRAQTVKQWEVEGLPGAFLDALEPSDGEERANHVHRCARGHRTFIHSAAHARRHLVSGVFQCPHCVAERTGIDASQVASLPRYRQGLEADLGALGLKVVAELPYDADGHLAAEVACPEGHCFAINRRDAQLMLKNACLRDRHIVPSACPQCCYPGVDPGSAVLLRGTVFHRLHVLRGMYPRARYLDGFDPVSRADERYACGETHADGTPHAPLRLSFRNLQKYARIYPDGHLCAACGLETGQVVGRGKTLHELVDLMKVMREEIARRRPLPGSPAAPTVQLVAGGLSAKGEVSSTTTRLRFWCGVDGHAHVESTKNEYFNRAPARGRGFCPQCVDLVGERKAPLPAGTPRGWSLRLHALRAAD